jgi:ABC-type multidrug transport system ATPase subunit
VVLLLFLGAWVVAVQGLDPASRHVLWDVIKAAKPGRSIILTTHSMEEAEVLCDR